MEISKHAVELQDYNHTSPSAWLVCFSAALFFFYEFIQGNMFSSIAPDVMRTFHIEASLYSGLSSIYYAANVIFLFPAGVILDRFSTKKIILTAMFLCVGGTFLFALADNFWLAVFCRFITGIGSAFCFLSCVRLASRWFPPSRMALVTGLTVTMAMTGGMVAQTPLTMMVQLVGWRMAVLLDGVLGLLIIVIIAAFVQDRPSSCDKSEHHDLAKIGFWRSLYLSYFKPQNLLAALYTSLMNMPVAILGAMAGGIYLVQAMALSRTEASYVVSMIFVGTIIGGPVVGFISDHIQRRRAPMLIGNVCSLATVLFILYSPSLNISELMALFFALGFFTSSQVISYPLVAENNSLALTATAVSVVSILTQGGYVLYQNLFGQILQSQWDGQKVAGVAIYSNASYHQALLIIPIGFVIALLAALLVKETYCKRKA